VKAGASPSGRFEIDVPASGVRAPALEYYLTALDDQGASVARAGTFSEPLVLEVQGERRPAAKRAWIWGVVGGVAAGVAVGLGVGLGLGLPNRNSPAQLTIIAPR
jgi:hypothetical protein